MREEVVVALNLPIWAITPQSELSPVPSFEPMDFDHGTALYSTLPPIQHSCVSWRFQWYNSGSRWNTKHSTPPPPPPPPDFDQGTALNSTLPPFQHGCVSWRFHWYNSGSRWITKHSPPPPPRRILSRVRPWILPFHHFNMGVEPYLLLLNKHNIFTFTYRTTNH